MRIAIAGAPRTGKSTLSEHLRKQHGYPVTHADDLMRLGWSEASEKLAGRLVEPGPYVIEGVAVVRALRKALELTTSAPCDVLYWLLDPFEPLSAGQKSMAKGAVTVFKGIERELIKRQVEIVRGIGAAPNQPSARPHGFGTQPADPSRVRRLGEHDPDPVDTRNVDFGDRWADFSGRGF